MTLGLPSSTTAAPALTRRRVAGTGGRVSLGHVSEAAGRRRRPDGHRPGRGTARCQVGRAEEIAVVDLVEDRRTALSDAHPGLVVLDAPGAGILDPDGGAVLAVKPDVAEGVTRVLGALGVTRVLSLVSGLQTQRLEAVLPAGAVVVRAMPNTPRSSRRVCPPSPAARRPSPPTSTGGGSPRSGGHSGAAPERHLDAVTGLSGSGPAYFFLVVESLIEAGCSPDCPGM